MHYFCIKFSKISPGPIICCRHIVSHIVIQNWLTNNCQKCAKMHYFGIKNEKKISDPTPSGEGAIPPRQKNFENFMQK